MVDRIDNLTLSYVCHAIENNSYPFAKEYLFQSIISGDDRLWKSNDFHDFEQLTVAPIDTNSHLMAVSPKDGRVIATRRAARGPITVFTKDEVWELGFEGESLKPMGWLYNAGVEFITGSDGEEYCIFAEYTGSVRNKDGFYIWKGKYPYNREGLWKRVLYKKMSWDVTLKDIPHESIVHFHQVRRDPWTDIIYTCGGDLVGQQNWWYSVDEGETWQLLIADWQDDYDWPEHTLRTINFIFTPDYVYWATDHGVNHTLNRIKRDEGSGVLNLVTYEKICDLPFAQACNTLCYTDCPRGLFMYERIDYDQTGEDGFSKYYRTSFKNLWFDLNKHKLAFLPDVRIDTDWGGNRGKCYIDYTNEHQPMPAMGFSADTPCVFLVDHPNPSEIGTVVYDLPSGSMRFLGLPD